MFNSLNANVIKITRIQSVMRALNLELNSINNESVNRARERD